MPSCNRGDKTTSCILDGTWQEASSTFRRGPPSLPALFLLLSLLLSSFEMASSVGDDDRPNVILILADDLGYGDLSFPPFTSPEMVNIKTPNLERMKKAGMVLRNFHAAAPMCSPSRASIMVGLFPWRLGVDFIYSQDLKRDGSEEMDHEQLPLLPNIAMALRDAGYFTAHVGKWHLGGISNYDIIARSNHSLGPCYVPGINQYGFDEYVAMTEGHEGKHSGKVWSSRSKTHEDGNTYSTGARYLIKNDKPLPRRPEDECLTDRQTEEGMRVIQEQFAAKRPFFLNLWYDAPHSPWEPIEPYYSMYKGKFAASSGQPMLQKYASMISNMDFNIGRVLDLVDSLGISSSTLILFTSDNGPENGAGFTGGLKGRKRLLTEGGIRVPCIWQWKTHIEAGAVSDKFVVSTDIFPTILQAARVRFPVNTRIDGVSILPVLTNGGAAASKPIVGTGDERIVLFYAHAPGHPKLTAAVSHGIKVLWNDYEDRMSANLPPSLRVFDLRLDPRENVNLLPAPLRSCGAEVEGRSISWADVLVLDHEKLLDIGGRKAGWEVSGSLARVAIRLVTHLYLRMHLFRHLGDADWRRYHQNKPFEHLPSCAIRSIATAETLVFDEGVGLAPEFCGEAVYAASRGRLGGCVCSIGRDCGGRWRKGGGWEEGEIALGLSALAPSSGTATSDTTAPWPHWWTTHTYLLQVLASSRYKGVCPGGQLTDKAYEGKTAVSLETRECGGMAASLRVNHFGMAHPLALCPSGLRSFESSNPDENGMLVALSELLYAPGREVLNMVGGLPSGPALPRHSIALLDASRDPVAYLVQRLDYISVVARPPPTRELKGPPLLLLSFLPLRSEKDGAWSLAISVATPASATARVLCVCCQSSSKEVKDKAESIFSRALTTAGYHVDAATATNDTEKQSCGSAATSGVTVLSLAAHFVTLIAHQRENGFAVYIKKKLSADDRKLDEYQAKALYTKLSSFLSRRGKEEYEKSKRNLDLMSKKGSRATN